VVLTLLVVACGSGGSGSDDDASDLLLRWSEVRDAAGYIIHWGSRSGAYLHALDVGAPERDADGIVSFLLEDLDGPGTIYFALSAYDADGRMSSLSNELSAELP
jgi:hypothetical protein